MNKTKHFGAISEAPGIIENEIVNALKKTSVAKKSIIWKRMLNLS
jgi:hypothetical protein